MQPWMTRQAVGLHRYEVGAVESVHIAAGFAMVAPVCAFGLSGLLVLDGLLIVGGGQ